MTIIEKIMEEAEIKMYDNWASDASDMKSLEQILTKHLSDKVIVDKKVIDDMIDGYKNAYSKWIIFIRPIDISYKLKSLLANQE